MMNNSTLSSAGNDSLAVAEEHEMNLGDILQLTFQVLIVLFGVSGNTLVVTVLARMGNKKQTGDFYLQNLAIADLGTLLLTFPIAVVSEKFPHKWPFGKFGCHFLYPISEIFYGASVWFITVIAVERCRKVVTVKIFARNKPRRALTVGVCVWMASFIIVSLPLFLVAGYHEIQHVAKWCGPEWPSWDHQGIISGGYNVILILFAYVVPLIIISFSYLMISRTVEQSNVFIESINQDENVQTKYQQRRASVRMSHNKRVKKILTPLVVVFAVTMLPLNILRVIVTVWPEIAAGQQYETYKNLFFVVTVFALVNSSVNPVIYCIVSRNFRKQIKDLFSRR